MTNILAKKLLYQSKNRGCRETDIILGSFAETYLHTMSNDELIEYQNILDLTDADLYDWISGKREMPQKHNTPIMQKLLKFNLV